MKLEEFKKVWQELMPNYAGVKTLSDVMKYPELAVKVQKGRKVVRIGARAYTVGVNDTVVLYSGYGVYSYPLSVIVGVEKFGK